MISSLSKYISLVISAVLIISSCTKQNNPADISERKVKVVATTGMIADAVKNVGGNRCEVTGLMGPGIDPHQYKATARDLARMFDADIIYYNGLYLEGKMADLFEKMGERGKTAVAVAEGIEKSRLLASSQLYQAYDPHIWFDVELWIRVIEIIRDSLAGIDSKNANIYQQNAEIYLEKLIQLNQYVKSQAQKVPTEKRVLITAHDAFHYFGRAYDFEVRGLQGISTSSEAGTGDLRDLADYIVERKIPAIFIESSIPVRNVEAIKAAVKSRGFEVVIGGELFSDAMGSEGTNEGTYIGMVEHNINTIVSSLLYENKISGQK